MVTRWFVFDTLTGEVIRDFEPISGSWGVSLNKPETVKVKVSLDTGDGINWRVLGTPWKHSLGVDQDGRLYGGPIMPHSYNAGSRDLDLTARGIRVYFDRRMILPPAALTGNLLLANGQPNPAMNTVLTGWNLATIGKRLVQQACSWPGAQLPMVFPADVTGTESRTYAALDFDSVDDALTKLSQVAGGPDIEIPLRWRDPLHVEWVWRAGALQGSTVHRWDLETDSVTGLSVSTDPSQMASLSWASGGRSNDTALVARATDMYLVDGGFPLLEVSDSSQSTAGTQAQLASWAAEPLRTGRAPTEFWKFSVRADAAPRLPEYHPGDLCEITVTHDPYIPSGHYRRRIVALGGDASGDWVDITCGEVYDG